MKLEKKIEEESLAVMLGINDQNLRYIKKQFPETKINVKGSTFFIDGEEVAIKNIHIVANEFVNWRQLPALTVMNAADVSIINNSFSRDPMITTRDTLWLGKKPLRILYSKNVEVEGNKFTGEDISSEPVRIIKSEDVKIRN